MVPTVLCFDALHILRTSVSHFESFAVNAVKNTSAVLSRLIVLMSLTVDSMVHLYNYIRKVCNNHSQVASDVKGASSFGFMRL